MISEAELYHLWQAPESERIEWKPSLAQTDSIYRAICAFANDLADYQDVGVIFIGREDDGRCGNKPLSDAEVRQFVQNIRESGAILPLPKLSYQQHVFDACPILAILVEPSHSTPVAYGGTVYVRSGPSSRKANPQELVALTERRQAKSFDAQPCNGATLGDLDLLYLEQSYIPSAVNSEVLADNGRTLAQQLAALRILSANLQPTYLGVLVGGKDPRRFLPGAYVQFLRIDGTQLGDPVLDQQEISGNIQTLLSKLYEKVQAHLRLGEQFNADGRRTAMPNYPFEALRELLANAIVHRDYEKSNAPVRVSWFNDRIEIINPGGPFGQVTDENFGQAGVTDYRNPELAAALKHLGYVQRFGYGIAVARRKLDANGNPEPEFERGKIDNYVLVIVREA